MVKKCIKIDRGPPPPLLLIRVLLAGGSRVGHQLTDFEMERHKGKPHKRSHSMDGNVPKCPFEFEGVFECSGLSTKVFW